MIALYSFLTTVPVVLPACGLRVYIENKDYFLFCSGNIYPGHVFGSYVLHV